jgi:hypothetical protein
MMAIEDEEMGRIVELQDELHRRPNAVRRIGMGLRALYNFALMERLPAAFSVLLGRLEKAELEARSRQDDDDGYTR